MAATAKAAIVLLSHLLEALTESKTPSDTEAGAIDRVVDFLVALIPNPR